MISAERGAWEALYAASEYRVRLPHGEIVLRVGHRGTTQDDLLRRAGVRTHWALLTPCNPGSQRLADDANRQRLEQLRAEVRELGLAGYDSFNRDPGGGWPDEPGLLLADAADGVVEALGRRYGQNAFLAGRMGQASQLVWLIP